MPRPKRLTTYADGSHIEYEELVAGCGNSMIDQGKAEMKLAMKIIDSNPITKSEIVYNSLDVDNDE
jgi:hypothetical protein